MSFSLNLLLYSLFSPPALCLWLSLLGLALLRTRHRIVARLLLGLGLGSLYFFSTGLCAAWLARGLEPVPVRPEDIAQRLQGGQAIVILGAGRIAGAPEYGGNDIPSYWADSRLRYGAWLYRHTGLPLLVTGGRVTGEKESEATIMARSLEQDFVVNVRWQEGNSKTTWENAKFTAEILKPLGVQKIVLVTSAFHMRRSIGTFEHFGFSVLPAATDYTDFWHMPGAEKLVPNAIALEYTQLALHEYVGLGWYAIRKWVE